MTARFYTTPLGQREKLRRLLDPRGYTLDDVKSLLAYPKLVDIMIDLLQGTDVRADPQLIRWTPVRQYAEKLTDWNEHFSLGFDKKQISNLMQSLPEHDGALQPTGISLTLGHGLASDLDISMQILEYELGKIGIRFENRLKNSRVEYFPGIEPKDDCKGMNVALLDIDSFWKPDSGVSAKEVRNHYRYLPTHEVALLLALSPHVFQDMDGRTFPYLVAAGLKVNDDEVPCFRKDKNSFFVDGGWAGNLWRSVVVLR